MLNNGQSASKEESMINYNKFTVEQFEQRLMNSFPKWEYEIINFQGYKKPLIIKCLWCSKIITTNNAEDFIKRVNPCSCRKIFKNFKEKIIHLSKIYNFQIINNKQIMQLLLKKLMQL